LHGAWELEVLSDLSLLSLAPDLVALDLPLGVAAVPLSEPMKPSIRRS
jgi:hypothetical protein